MTTTDDLEVLELVDGQLRTPAEVVGHWLTRPDTGERIRQQRASSAGSLAAALEAAERVNSNGVWAMRPAAERTEILRRFTAELALLVERMAFADSVDSGVPLRFTRAMVAASTPLPERMGRQAETLLYAEMDDVSGPADQYWSPWGPAAIFIPWNAPATMALRKSAAALAAGASVILKPSEWAPHSASLIAKASCAAGLPPGAFQVLHGGPAIGEALASDRRIGALSYTGGSIGGRAVAQRSARFMRPVDLELAGCNPVVVLDDADLEMAADLLTEGMCTLNGQWCAGPRRVFAPATMVQPLAEAILDAHAAQTVIGSITGENTTLGPMADAPHLERLRVQLDEFTAAGANVRTAGETPELAGHFLLPTVITGAPAELNRTEVFGPVITISPYRDIDDAITQANDHEYGLRAYVLSGDRGTARTVGRQLRAGHVCVNGLGLRARPADAVISMWGESGLGTIGTVEGIRFFTGARYVG